MRVALALVLVLAATGAARATSYSGTVLADGPREYWRLGEAPGNPTAADASGNGHTGTYSNVTLGQPSALTTDPNTSAAFNGSSSFVSFGTGASLNGTTDFTVEAWVKTTSSLAGVVVAQRYTSAAVLNGEWMLSVGGIEAGGPGQVNFWMYNTDFGVNLASTRLVNDGVWHQVVGVRQGASGAVYIDGVLDASSTGNLVTSLSNALPISIGYDSAGAGFPFSGGIDEVAIFTSALTATQVRNQYLAAVPEPAEAILIALSGLALAAAVRRR